MAKDKKRGTVAQLLDFARMVRLQSESASWIMWRARCIRKKRGAEVGKRMAGDAHELGVVEDTLFVPMLGRIYASERCRNILFDEKVLELKDS